MKIFVTSDLHLGHSNIIKLCSRPFKNVEEMDEVIIKNWNKVVSNRDTVYVVGDMSFKGKNLGYYLDRLNGNIILIKGNHDKECNHPRLTTLPYVEISVNGQGFVLSHYPITSWNGCFRNVILLYGHVHSTGKDWEFVNFPNAHNVCCELHDYKPVEITKFVALDFVGEMKKLGKL